jgi:hypothetical protein
MTIEEPAVEPNVDPAADPAEPASPDLEAKLAAVQEEKDKLEKQMKESQLATEKNIQDLQRIVADAFAAPAEPKPEPEKVDIDPMDPETYVRAMEQVADSKVAAGQKATGQVMRTLLEDSFETKKEALKANNPEVWKQIGEEFNKFYETNPTEKLRGPQSAEQVYQFFAGKWMLQNPDAAREVHKEVPVTPTTPSITPPTTSKDDEEPELTPLELHLAKQYGVDPKRYAENRDDKQARKRDSFKEERRLW